MQKILQKAVLLGMALTTLFTAGAPLMTGCNRDAKRNESASDDVKPTDKKNKPNLLFVMADQWRVDWIGEAGAGFLKTPNIDAIAREGMRFPYAICNNPVCAPSRVSIAMGLYSNRFGGYENDCSLYPAKVHNFEFTIPSYYSMLKDDGYRVGVVGKTDFYKGSGHLIYKDGITYTDNAKSGFPLLSEMGFTDSWTTIGKTNPGTYIRNVFKNEEIAQKYDQFYQEIKDTKAHVGIFPLPIEYYHDYYIGRKAVELIRQFETETSDKPWHLFVSFVGPHGPFDAPEKYSKMYENTEFPESANDGPSKKPNNPRIQNLKFIKQQYAGMMTLIDDWVGEMRKTLEEFGVNENTVIIFTADHGEMMGDHDLFAKQEMYEGALRVPLIISHPKMPAKGVSMELAELVDMYPTILDIVGISYDNRNIDGKSLVPLLQGQQVSHKDYQYSENGYVKEWPYAKQRMVFDGQYKYIVNAGGKEELYDLKADPKELKNITKEQTETVERLKGVMDSFCKDALPPQNTPEFIQIVRGKSQGTIFDISRYKIKK